MRDFAVDVSGSLAAGPRELVLINDGPTVHELVVARTHHAAGSLPLSADGLSADEPNLETVGADEFVALGDSDSLFVDLPVGHYVFYCNIDGHYGSGMHADVNIYDATSG
jgi:uncharacterized cupredoxin-like copper-binding protein